MPTNWLRPFLDEFAASLRTLSKTKTGALIIVHGSDLDLPSKRFKNAVAVSADFTAPLLESIFCTSSPLHDGALVLSVSKGVVKISAAKVLIRMKAGVRRAKKAANTSTGTRHLAASVYSRKVPNVAVLTVSESTGLVSLARHGKLEELALDK